MVKRLTMVALLLTVGFAFSGCRFAGGLESACGRECQECGAFGNKNCAIMRQWGRDARKSERCIDHLFFNYDVNDPYRGDCLVGY